MREPFSPFGIGSDRYENKTMLFYDAACAEAIGTEIGGLHRFTDPLLKAHPSGIPDAEVDAYNGSPALMEVWSSVRDMMYVRPGRYRVTIRSHVEEQFVDAVFYIEITHEQQRSLSANASAIVSMAKIESLPFQYNVVFARIYREEPLPRDLANLASNAGNLPHSRLQAGLQE